MVDTVGIGEFRFDRIVVRGDLRQLLVDGQPAKVGARAFDLLCALIERRDRVVGKNELLETVWPDLVVEENNLQVHISALRKLLGPSAIATVPGRGYRFTGQGAQAAPAPSAAAPAAPPPPAPPTLPTLFGRTQDLSRLLDLAANHRLVTLVGAGGVGKTRLAQAALHALRPAHADGIEQVEFAGIADPGLVLGTAARILGVAMPAKADAAYLATRLTDRRAVLLLDNCEHLVQAIAELASALLQGAPHLRLLATSQLPLRLADEQVQRLEPLDVGADGALALFEARTRAVQPWFKLDATNQADVADICRRLDGIPLAIELAAARVPLLGVDGLRQRLDQRFRLLTASPRDAPARQQTLHAALAWSHGLLEADEQRVFRRLGRFMGGFGLAAVQAVAADDGEDEWSVLDTLGALVDKSLVIADPDPTPRYRLLESTRAFALEQLEAAGESRTVARRHAQALIDQMDPFLGTWVQGQLRSDTVLPPLLRELDNLRAAVAWADGPQGDAELLVGLMGNSWWLWKPAGVAPEGLRWCERAVERLQPTMPKLAQARLLYGFGSESHQHAAERELDALRRSARLYRELGDGHGEHLALVLLSHKLVWHNDLDGAARAIDEAEALWDDRWPETMHCGLLTAHTYVLEASGRPAEGQPLMEELVALMRRHGDARQLDFALMQLAESLFVQGKVEPAIALRREVVERIGERPADYAAANLGNLGAALTRLGDTEAALAAARQALPGLRRADRVATFLDHFALLASLRGRHRAAARAVGCADACQRLTGFVRELSEQQAHESVLARLRDALPADEIEALKREGALLGPAAAADLALGD